MTDKPQNDDALNRDEILKRLLQTPPQPKGGKQDKEGEKKPKDSGKP